MDIWRPTSECLYKSTFCILQANKGYERRGITKICTVNRNLLSKMQRDQLAVWMTSLQTHFYDLLNISSNLPLFYCQANNLDDPSSFSDSSMIVNPLSTNPLPPNTQHQVILHCDILYLSPGLLKQWCQNSYHLSFSSFLFCLLWLSHFIYQDQIVSSVGTAKMALWSPVC